MKVLIEGISPDMIANNLNTNAPIHTGEMIKD